MINYQYALRGENCGKLNEKKADTSFLLFPIRLETKFKDQLFSRRQGRKSCLNLFAFYYFFNMFIYRFCFFINK